MKIDYEKCGEGTSRRQEAMELAQKIIDTRPEDAFPASWTQLKRWLGDAIQTAWDK